MPSTVEQFKRAFAATASDDLTRRDQQTAAALKALKQSVERLGNGEAPAKRFKDELVNLVQKYKDAKEKTDRPRSEIVAELESIGRAAVTKLLELKGASSGSAGQSAAGKPVGGTTTKGGATTAKGGPSDGNADARIDAATYQGFSAWLHPAIRAADDACVDAERTSNSLGSPYQGRMQRLIRSVVELRNLIDNQSAALAEGRAAPDLTANARGLATQLEERVQKLVEVTEAWDAVHRSGIFELLAQHNESRLRRAEALREELRACEQELQRLHRIAEGREMVEAFAQTGLAAAISGAEMAISVANPVVGIAISVGAAATQLTLDALLGPSGPGLDTFSASGASVAGSALQNLAKAGTALNKAGRGLGMAGTAAGTVTDVLESRDAIRQYEAARGQIIALSSRIERIAGELDALRPLLACPQLTWQLIDGMRNHAAILREQGQLALQGG